MIGLLSILALEHISSIRYKNLTIFQWFKYRLVSSINKKQMQPIIDRLKEDEDIINFFKVPESDQRGKWRKLIATKLTNDELKFVNKIHKTVFI